MYDPTVSPDPSEFLDTSIHVRRAQGGDPGSIDWLVRHLTPVLLAQAEMVIPDELRRHVDADDVVSEAWGIVLPKLGDIRERNGRVTPPLMKYFSTVVRNRVRTLGRDVQGRMKSSESAERARRDITEEPFLALIRAERHSALYREIQALESLDRTILVRRGIEQVAVAELAEALDMRPNSLTIKYLRLLAKLRNRFRGSVLDELDES